MSDSRPNHLAVLGCVSDAWALTRLHEMITNSTASSGGFNGAKTSSELPFMATLNHTIWFHDPFVRLDDWLLVKRKSSWVGHGRCLVEQQFWDKQGALVATCVQEGTSKGKQVDKAAKHSQSKI